MQLKVITLQQDRSLIKSNFNGYKLSLDTIPVISRDIVPPFRSTLAEDQISFLHVELFTLHNHLVEDPWDRKSCYYIDENGALIHCTYDDTTGQPGDMKEVFKFALKDRERGDYNVTLLFVSQTLCVFCNGKNEIFLIETGSRVSGSGKWKLIYEGKVHSKYKHFVLRDARTDEIDGVNCISLLLQSIGYVDGTSVTRMILGNLSLDKKTGKWVYSSKTEIYGKGSVNYCSIEPKAQALVISCHKDFTFQTEEPSVPDVIQSTQEHDKKCDESVLYTWSQTKDLVNLKFNCTHSTEIEDYHVTCRGKAIHVKCKENVMLDGDLFDEAELTTWALENDSIHITLMKKDQDKPSWPVIVEGGPPETQNDCSVDVAGSAGVVPSLESQSEECDRDDNNPEEEYFIERLDLRAKKASHKIFLGSKPILFSKTLKEGFPAAIATRQDVDASVWLQICNHEKPHEWMLHHEGNLHAFNYIQESKQKKFISCSPSLEYAVISESHRHVFIYKTMYGGENKLRNRTGQSSDVGKQHVVVLEGKEEILGMVIMDAVTIILTEKNLLYLQVHN